MKHVVFETCYTCCISLVIILPVDGDESRKKDYRLHFLAQSYFSQKCKCLVTVKEKYVINMFQTKKQCGTFPYKILDIFLSFVGEK